MFDKTKVKYNMSKTNDIVEFYASYQYDDKTLIETPRFQDTDQNLLKRLDEGERLADIIEKPLITLLEEQVKIIETD